jgi:hypothetical protein
VTNTLSPSPLTAQLRRRHLTGDANARSTAILNAAFHANAQITQCDIRFGCTRGAQNHDRGTRSAAVPVQKLKNQIEHRR